MIEAAIPANEDARMADVVAVGLLDSPPEARFDRISSLVSKWFDAPIAYIAIVDSDRQWFKSRIGLCPVQTDRSISFCGHAILHDEPTIVPDALEDERFHDNPMVTGPPHIRFYAGHPLKGPTGHNVATLCVADRKPRQFTERDCAAFREFAAIAEHELHMHEVIAAQKELIRTREELYQTQKQLGRELADAARYVESLLPAPLTGAVAADYRYISSSRLGGDILGYQWLGEKRLAVYLLDVCGHGVASSLLSVSALNTIRGGQFAPEVLDDPAAVLTALNRNFQMEDHDGRFFTIWYGVLDLTRRELRYASAGHPPAIYMKAGGLTELLGSPNFMIGVMPDATFQASTVPLEPASRLFLYSDGAYETRNGDGKMLEVEGLVQMFDEARSRADLSLDSMLREIREYQQSDTFEDDFSMMDIAIR